MTHDSLTDKTPYGLGAHGGATPEELLVPILIVSGQRNSSNYSVELLQTIVSANDPFIRYRIKGLLPCTADVPVVKYNGITYSLYKTGNNIYETAAIELSESVNKVSLVIGSYTKTGTISVKIGVSEDDIFGDL